MTFSNLKWLKVILKENFVVKFETECETSFYKIPISSDGIRQASFLMSFR